MIEYNGTFSRTSEQKPLNLLKKLETLILLFSCEIANVRKTMALNLQ